MKQNIAFEVCSKKQKKGQAFSNMAYVCLQAIYLSRAVHSQSGCSRAKVDALLVLLLQDYP